MIPDDLKNISVSFRNTNDNSTILCVDAYNTQIYEVKTFFDFADELNERKLLYSFCNFKISLFYRYNVEYYKIFIDDVLTELWKHPYSVVYFNTFSECVKDFVRIYKTL